MRQNTNSIQARGRFHKDGSFWSIFCIYSHIDSIKCEIELISLKITYLSLTIDIAYEANLDFKTG